VRDEIKRQEQTQRFRRSLPRPFLRERIARGVVFAIGLLLLAGIIAQLTGVLVFPLGTRATPLSLIYSVFCLVAFGWIREARRSGAERMLREHQGFVCLFCHYPLTNLPDEGRCPECGTEYTRAETVEIWRGIAWPTERRKSPR
jgi:hypothetical protein